MKFYIVKAERVLARQFRLYHLLEWVETWRYSIKIIFEQGLRCPESFRFGE